MIDLMARAPSANWIMNGNEFGAVPEGCLHLHFRDHFADTFHDLGASNDHAAFRHELRDRFTVARSFQHEIRYESDRLRIIELDASCTSAASNERRKCDHQFVSFTRRE